MAAMNQVSSLFADLQKEWAKPAKNLKKCGELLDQLKVNFPFIVKMIGNFACHGICHSCDNPCNSRYPFQIALTKLVYLPTGNVTASQKELMLARDVLEIGVEYCIAVRDIPAYERYMSQLKCYYYDYK